MAVQIASALHAAGVFGFKCFLLHSGVDEFPPLDAAEMERDMAELAGFGGLLIVHAEDPALLAPDGPLGPRYSDFVASRPAASEGSAISSAIARGITTTPSRSPTRTSPG